MYTLYSADVRPSESFVWLHFHYSLSVTILLHTVVHLLLQILFPKPSTHIFSRIHLPKKRLTRFALFAMQSPIHYIFGSAGSFFFFFLNCESCSIIDVSVTFTNKTSMWIGAC